MTCCDDPMTKDVVMRGAYVLPVINRKEYIAAMVAMGVEKARASMDFELDVARKKIVEAQCCR